MLRFYLLELFFPKNLMCVKLLITKALIRIGALVRINYFGLSIYFEWHV